MKVSIIRITIVFLVFGISNSTSAQTTLPQDVVDNYVEGVTSDFNQYMNHYMNPLLKGLGFGFNNGWYNTARPHKSFGFDLTISVNAAYVPVVDQSFKLDPQTYRVFDLADPNEDILPTVMGGTTTTELNAVLDKSVPNSPFVGFPVLDGVQEYLPLKVTAVPSPIIQIGVGIVKGTEVKVRWIPSINNTDGLNYNYWGMGVMHSVSQWIPVVKEMKFLDISGFIGFTNISLSYTLDPGTIEGADQSANFGVKTFNYQVVASATASVITGYIGLGYDDFKTDLSMNGEYLVEIPGTGTKAPLIDPVQLDAKDGGFRATFGARLKLAIFTIHADYTFQGYNTLNAGIGFSFR